MVSDVSPSRPLGGGERMLWEQARRLAARGHDVRVVSRADPDATAPVSVEQERVRIHRFLADRRSITRFIRSSVFGARRAVSEALAHQPADVLHVHQPLAGYGALASAAGARLPSLYSFYSPAPLEYRSRQGMTARHRAGLMGATATAMLWAIERACLRRAGLVHVLSDFSADQLWKLYAVPRERIVKIRGAAATDRFRPAPDRGAIRCALGLSADRPLLLTVRNLEARMGLDALLDAMALLKARCPNAMLLIGGAGSLRGALEAQSQALGLGDRVKFLGFVPDAELPRYYQAADVFVLPTRELEGFGLVTVEALACGTPVLGTPVGATPEILRALCPSLVFRGTAPEVMAEDLERFLAARERDPDGYARLRDACREHVERHYTWQRATEELEGTLRRVVDAKREVNPPRRADTSGEPVDAPGGHADVPTAHAHAALGPAGSDPAFGCPACGAPTRRSGLVYRGVRHRLCPSCRSSLSTKLPTASELQHTYETEYPLLFAPEQVTSERTRLFGALLDRLAALGRARAERPRLIDVGCGGGHLAALARSRRWLAVSTDIAHPACAVAGRAGEQPAIQADGALLPFRGGTVDMVTLVNVVDQAHEPLTILREAHRVLVAGGLLALRVPNARFHRPWARLLIALGPLVRSRGWDTYPVVHHFAFTPSGLRRLVERAGFRVLEVSNSAAASKEPVAKHAAAEMLPRWGRATIAAGAAALAELSRDRWLVGPSVELYARKGPR
jgi:glycosyltransferase involved in cell wall biosynthesis/SAM-dependent methyltransferase